MKAQTVKLSLERRAFDIRAYVVGDLAIHRRAFWVAKGSPLSIGGGWTLSHVPTGLGIESALRGRVPTTRAPMLAIAEAWQAECPEYFDALRKAGPRPTPAGVPVDVAMQAREALDRLIQKHLPA